MKLTIAVLGHHDGDRYHRALESAEIAAARADAVVVQPVVDVNGSLDFRGGAWAVYGGNAARAKAELFRRWHEESQEGDWVYQLDGDDMLEPGGAEALLRDISLANADLIGYYGFNALDGDRWGMMAQKPWPAGPGIGAHWDAYPYITSWMPSLWNRRAVEVLDWPEDMEAYEDGLICYQALAAHQQGRLRVCISGGTDIVTVDQTTPGSVQKTANMDFWADVLRQRRQQWVTRERSNWGELEWITPPETASEGAA